MLSVLCSVLLLAGTAYSKPTKQEYERKDQKEFVSADKTTLKPVPFSVLACGTHTISPDTAYTITSPNHPGNYGDNYDCLYNLLPGNGAGTISITCSAFNLESSSTCRFDYLSVNGIKHCGSTGPNTASQSPGMIVKFHTDTSVVRSGYSCTVQAARGSSPAVGNPLKCGSYILSAGEYNIKSVNSPGNYNNNVYCPILIKPQSGVTSFSLTCSSFDLENQSSCKYDYLSINGVKYCGTQSPSISGVNELAIDFRSDSSIVRPGYHCKITAHGSGGSSSCSCGVPNRSSRVVGGQETEVNEYPWQAGLVHAGQTRTWCGGVLINNLYVLTAAHCTKGKSASSIQVLLGDHRISVSDGESRHSIASITNHPSYTYVTSGNDFSLLRLSAPVVFNTRRRPACMPQANNDYAGATAIATGFGRVGATSPQATELQEVEVPVWSQQQCSSKWSIVPTILCAGGYPQGGRSVCMGDSGGPLVTLENNKYSVIGVVSYGRACAFANTPDVYARVSAVLPWITANTQGATWCT